MQIKIPSGFCNCIHKIPQEYFAYYEDRSWSLARNTPKDLSLIKQYIPDRSKNGRPARGLPFSADTPRFARDMRHPLLILWHALRFKDKTI